LLPPELGGWGASNSPQDWGGAGGADCATAIEEEGRGKWTTEVWRSEILAGDDVFSLHNVDYSEKGMELEIIVEGQRKLQTVIYSTVDYQGEKWYYGGRGKLENGKGKRDKGRRIPSSWCVIFTGRTEE